MSVAFWEEILRWLVYNEEWREAGRGRLRGSGWALMKKKTFRQLECLLFRKLPGTTESRKQPDDGA